MRVLIIDRFEGPYAVCEDKEEKFFAIEHKELPEGAKAGTVLNISDDGVITVDENETERRRQRILQKQKSILDKM